MGDNNLLMHKVSCAVSVVAALAPLTKNDNAQDKCLDAAFALLERYFADDMLRTKRAS
jgi:hypothetical protein